MYLLNTFHQNPCSSADSIRNTLQNSEHAFKQKYCSKQVFKLQYCSKYVLSCIINYRTQERGCQVPVAGAAADLAGVQVEWWGVLAWRRRLQLAVGDP